MEGRGKEGGRGEYMMREKGEKVERGEREKEGEWRKYGGRREKDNPLHPPTCIEFSILFRNKADVNITNLYIYE